MKNKIKIHLLLLVIALIGIISTSSAQDTVLAVEPTKMNVLYMGIDNPLTIAYTAKYDSVAISAGRLIPTDKKGDYVAHLYSGGTADINVFSAGKIIATKSFRVKRIPDPKICIAGRTEIISMKRIELNQIAGIGAKAPGFEFDMVFLVVSFEVFFYSNGSAKQYSIYGNQLSEECKAGLKSADVGKPIWLDNPKVKCPDGSIRYISPLKITLTD